MEITFRQLGVCYYKADSLKREWVCNLQFLLDSSAQSFSDLSPAGLMAIFYWLNFQIPPKVKVRVILWLIIGLSVLVSHHHLGPTTNFLPLPQKLSSNIWDFLFIFLFGMPTLTWGWVCNLLPCATGPCQHCHSGVQVPQNLRPYFTVSIETGFFFRHLLWLTGLRWKYSHQHKPEADVSHSILVLPSFPGPSWWHILKQSCSWLVLYHVQWSTVTK
jgi:hypothetical protein